MRVLTIVSDLGFGGTQRNAQNCAEAYQAYGFESAILAWEGGGSREDPLERAGIPLFVGSKDSVVRAKAIERAIKWSPDTIHVHRPGMADPLTSSILREARNTLGRRVRTLETNVFARVDFSSGRSLIDVHCLLSRWCLWKWTRWSQGQSPRPIGVVIPNMVVDDAFAPVSTSDRVRFRERHGIPEAATVFLRVGSPLAGKWHPIAFRAFARFAQRDPDARFVVVGCPPEYRSLMRELPPSERARIVDIPILIGDGALRECYGSCDVFLHAATIGESFGLVLCEAMLSGLPVITLSTPAKDNSQIEVVGHERGGLVVTGEAPMIEAMERLAADRDLRRRLAEQGATRVRREFSRARVLEQLVRLISHLHAADDRSVLRARLSDDASMITSVSDDHVRVLLAQVVGRHSWRQLALMGLVHSPRLYRIWAWCKHRIVLARRRGRRAAAVSGKEQQPSSQVGEAGRRDA